MVAVPAVGRTRFSTIRSVVVLPAPFGPRNPVTRPGSTVNDRSSTARSFRYTLVRPETTICPSDISPPLVVAQPAGDPGYRSIRDNPYYGSPLRRITHHRSVGVGPHTHR